MHNEAREDEIPVYTRNGQTLGHLNPAHTNPLPRRTCPRGCSHWVRMGNTRRYAKAKGWEDQERKVHKRGYERTMTCFEIVLAIINIVAVIAAPIIAVQVGQYLQDRAQLRKDKMDVFKTLMANRVGWSTASVYAMNIIDIVFADDTSVRQCWKDYYEKLSIRDPNEDQQKQIQASHERLLESMAISLGYKDKITWEAIQNPYFPQALLDSMRQQQIIQGGQELLAGYMPSVLSRMIGGSFTQNQEKCPEDKPHADA